ncbi:MAG: transposase [Flavobacteriales bacterium Tduv]
MRKNEKRNKKNISKRLGNKNQPAYSEISLFTMMVLNHCYDLSDIETEKLVKESLICMRFCGFRLEDQIPDHASLCKFRNEIIDKKAYKHLLKKINKELRKHQEIIKTGVMVDANITMKALYTPKGSSYLRSGGSEGREEKSKSVKKSKEKKDSIKSRK